MNAYVSPAMRPIDKIHGDEHLLPELTDAEISAIERQFWQRNLRAHPKPQMDLAVLVEQHPELQDALLQMCCVALGYERGGLEASARALAWRASLMVRSEIEGGEIEQNWEERQ